MTTRTRSRRLKRKQQEMVENGGVCIQRHRELAEDILSKSLVLSPERHRMLHPCCAERRVIGARPKQDGTISRESPSAQLQGLRPHVSSQKALRLRESGLLTESSSGRLRERDVKALPGRLAVPGSVSAIVDEHQSRGYCGQFSRDGSVFVSAFQGRCVRVYDVENNWSLEKDIEARMLQWTITDCSLSPDGEFLVYSSITPVLHLVRTRACEGVVRSVSNITEIHEALDLDPSEGGLPVDRAPEAFFFRRHRFGVWSAKWAPNGTEIAAGTTEPAIQFYDVERRAPIAATGLHKDDVNAVCYVWRQDPNMLVSGSDDSLLRIWDRRLIDGSGNMGPVSCLPGHTDGITHADSRGDGRYILTNGKDQAARLWDLRTALSASDTFRRGFTWRYRPFEWDYRWESYPEEGRDTSHPNDRSVIAYRGHHVLTTLIRAYFSPEESTGGQYVYTGSACGGVFVYELLSGRLIARLRWHDEPVRDVSWHPRLPMMGSVSFDGCIALWEPRRGAEHAVAGINGDKFAGFF